jgi:hypothetical protein
MIYKSYICFALLFIGHLATAQQTHCGQVDYQNYLKKKYPQLEFARLKLEQAIANAKLNNKGARIIAQTINVPVVFHIVYNTSTQNISDTRIKEQIDIINQDYRRLNADTINVPDNFKPLVGSLNIKFTLATRDPTGKVTNGINRYKTLVSKYDFFYDDGTIKNFGYWPSNQYLNVWVTNLADNILGYAEFPTTDSLFDLSQNSPESIDGVVVSPYIVGYTNDRLYNKGRTLTHEIGHWLGLYHPWGNDFCGDDYVDDTPVQDSSSGYLQPSNCVSYSNCTGKITMDMSNCFMDYSPDACMNMFSEGQVARMGLVLETAPRRMMIKDSEGSFNPESVYQLPYEEYFQEGLDSLSDTTQLSNTKMSWQIAPYLDSQVLISQNNFTPKDSLVFQTKYLDFTPLNKPKLTFDFATIFTEKINADSLVIYHQPTPKRRIKIAKLSSNELATPTNAGALMTKIVDISDLGKNYISKIIFVYYSNSGNTLLLDNLRIYDNLDRHEILLYPNPTEEVLNIAITQDNQEEMSFDILNSMGIPMKSFTANKLSQNISLDLKELNKGLYHLIVKFKDSNTMRKAKFVVY